MAKYLCQVLCLKYNRIKKIVDKSSADQLVSDIAYFKKLMVQFGQDEMLKSGGDDLSRI